MKGVEEEDKDGIFMGRKREGWVEKRMKRGCLCEEDKAQKAHAHKNRARNMVV